MSSIDSLIANYNPDAVRNANLAAVSNSNLAQSGARLNQSQADEVALKNKITQRQLHDEEIYRQILADVGRQSMQPAQPAQPPEGEEAAMQAIAPGAVPAGSPAPASPPQATGPAAPQAATPPASPQIPDLFTNPRVFQVEAARRGMSGAGVMSGVKQLIDQQSGLSKLNTEQLDNEVKAHGLAADSLRGYLETPDGAAKPQAYAAFYEDLSKEAPEAQKWLPRPGIGVAPTSDDLAHVTGMLHLTGTLLDAAKTKQETASSAAAAIASAAAAKASNVESEDKQFRLNLLKNAAAGQTPDFSTTVKGMSIFANHPQEAQDAIDAASTAYTAALKSGEPLKAATDANEAVKGIADRLRAVSPGVVAGEANKAKQVLQATKGITEEISAAESSQRNALEQGDTATAKYYESLTSAKKAQATANTIQRVVDLARSDNNLAAQQLKAMVPELTNAVQDIKRTGGGQSGQMASSLENAIGEIQSSTGSSPLSKKTINSIAPFVDVIANGAAQQHNANVQALKQAYPQKSFALEPLPHQSATGPNGHKIVSHDGGETWQDAKTGAEVR